MAIGVIDAVAEIDIGALRGFHHQHLVAADPKMAISELADMLVLQAEALGYQVNDNKVVTQPVHFCKSKQHSYASCASPVARLNNMDAACKLG
jgi:hypothetical protein